MSSSGSNNKKSCFFQYFSGKNQLEFGCFKNGAIYEKQGRPVRHKPGGPQACRRPRPSKGRKGGSRRSGLRKLY